MLKRFAALADTEELRAFEQIGRSHGLKTAHAISVAIAKYIASETERTKAAPATTNRKNPSSKPK